ncbi:YolD-like family protein [Macrococcoides bohemicum]|nr:YolD-like family protein [Macrococcus bohemicus]
MKVHNINEMHPTVPYHLIKETNYKKIPRKYLERNIPKGRGMIKWAPFATIPQQYSELREIIKKQEYEYMPLLSSDQISVINVHIHEAILNKKEYTIIYYNEVEYKKKLVQGVVKKIFDLEHYIVLNLCNTNSLFRIDFKHIIDIRLK